MNTVMVEHAGHQKVSGRWDRKAYSAVTRVKRGQRLSLRDFRTATLAEQYGRRLIERYRRLKDAALVAMAKDGDG